jgi:hypothetical protein
MTKKDYIAIAQIIRRNSTITSKYYTAKDIAIVAFLKDLCEYLKSDNPRFDEAKFLEAIN